jgi:hypothetical protein
MDNEYDYFVPSQDAELGRWASVYYTKIDTIGPLVGLTPPIITTHKDAATAVTEAVNKVRLKRQELKEAVIAKNRVRQNEVRFLCKEAAKIKLNENFTENIGGELGILSTIREALRTELKPTIKLNTFRGSVEVLFLKKAQPGVAIYSKLRGEAHWQFLAYTPKSPYIDTRPLAVADKAETREYMVRCSDGLTEVGLDSDIVSTLYGG